MENLKLDDSDKENAAPPFDSEVNYPVLPLNPKGNILMKQPHPTFAARLEEAEVKTPPSIARKRQRLVSLRCTPPRPSHLSQMKKIFQNSTQEAAHSSTLGIPPDSMQLFQHFSQALRCDNDEERRDSVINDQPSIDCYSSDTASEGSDDETETRPSLQRPPRKAQSLGQRPSKRHNDGRDVIPTLDESSDQNDPLHDLGRAVVRSPDGTAAHYGSSTEDWTGDKIFFHRQYAPHISQNRTKFAHDGRQTALRPSDPSQVPATQPCRNVLRAPPAAAFPAPTSPLRTPRSSRFYVSRVENSMKGSPQQAGVPLCMEKHPPSASSDADDEAESEDW